LTISNPDLKAVFSSERYLFSSKRYLMVCYSEAVIGVFCPLNSNSSVDQSTGDPTTRQTRVTTYIYLHQCRKKKKIPVTSAVDGFVPFSSCLYPGGEKVAY
jgi:hypothetical protein